MAPDGIEQFVAADQRARTRQKLGDDGKDTRLETDLSLAMRETPICDIDVEIAALIACAH